MNIWRGHRGPDFWMGAAPATPLEQPLYGNNRRWITLPREKISPFGKRVSQSARLWLTERIGEISMVGVRTQHIFYSFATPCNLCTPTPPRSCRTLNTSLANNSPSSCIRPRLVFSSRHAGRFLQPSYQEPEMFTWCFRHWTICNGIRVYALYRILKMSPILSSIT